MRGRFLTEWILTILAVCALSASAAEPSPQLRTIVGIVDTGEAYGDFVVFDLVRIDQRFAFDPRIVKEASALAEMLASSKNTGRSISIHYFVDGAIIPFGEVKPIYRLHDVTYDGKKIEIETALPPRDSNTVLLPRDEAAESVARGIALSGDPDAAEARNALTVAANSEALEPALRALALKSRIEVNVNDGLQNWGPGSDRDKLFVAALADARSWQAMAPDDKEAATAIASGLASLGADDEAIAAYRDIMRRWPDDIFWEEVRIASIYRREGDTANALGTLDDLIHRAGPQEGMAYHYHRGWILLKASRYQDAIDEFTAGLKDQPDYSGAFMQRACALGAVGRIDEALADWKQMIASRAQWGDDLRPSPGLKYDIAYQDDVQKKLQAAQTTAPHAPNLAACSGGWDWGDGPRSRSPLLPPG
ncbi:MAG: tetratricopeptide repeat protein [Alphaproteobacteria bacterium]|nr:tetratricopeptide repeat protein [Alphaproteobacteria bacterium]MBL6939236.1 tetratricopeptide repeat protein [Alphaproteobacteria bacterium]MBL7096752.1 tetratricopeptide repeat protein [Alphaproteobacteria bacterium]